MREVHNNSQKFSIFLYLHKGFALKLHNFCIKFRAPSLAHCSYCKAVPTVLAKPKLSLLYQGCPSKYLQRGGQWKPWWVWGEGRCSRGQGGGGGGSCSCAGGRGTPTGSTSPHHPAMAPLQTSKQNQEINLISDQKTFYFAGSALVICTNRSKVKFALQDKY